MRTFTVVGGAMLLVALAQGSSAQTPPAQGAPATPQTGERGRGPQRPPLLPTPPLTAPPTPDADGNFVIGPPYTPAPELTVKDGVPKGTVHEFTMDSKDSKIYSGIARAQPGAVVPYTRKVAVYVPAQYVAGTPAPFIVVQDGMSDAYRNNVPLDPRQPHSREARAPHGRGHGAQRRRRCPGQSARAGIRHGLGRLHRFHRDRSAPPHHQGVRDRVHQGSRGARDDGRQFGRGLRVHHGVVPSGALSARPLLLRNLCEPAVAAESRDAARRVGISRHLDSLQPGQADPHLDARERVRQSQQRPGRHLAQLGAGERPHGGSAQSQGLQVPVRLFSRLTARRSRRGRDRRSPKRWSGSGRDIRSDGRD